MSQQSEPLTARSTMTFCNDPLWYKDAIIYQLHVKSFFDANNDGIGDFKGLISKLDYIESLGVNTIWILPFYPSPLRDDGYDIAQYLGVHPDYGTMSDVRRFIQGAHKRGMRVITELVINHTSDQHPWFQRARRARPGSVARNYYVWSDTDQKYAGTRIIFCDTEKSNWTWDPVAQAYYWHRFYAHQPDLNFDNPRVLQAVLGVMKSWLELGVDGLRLDAVPYLIEREGTNNENLPETHDILKRIRAEVDAHFPDRMLLAEANQWPEDTRQYFGDGDECHMAFHFPLMPRMYMALAQEDRFPITDILRQTPDIPDNCQWAIFLRNHDELTLEMVTDRERDYLWEQYAADRRARINLGIRRRLAPLLERDRRRIELLNSLLLSMPGTPVLYYGDEICMGDNIYLGDRDGVRTPMQWSPDRNGGFSRADPSALVLPPIMDPLYGFESTNVESQTRDVHSLLNWTRRMLAVRKQKRAFGRGSFKQLSPTNRCVLAYLREFEDDDYAEHILCVANLSRTAQAVELDLSYYNGKVPVEMTGNSPFPPIGRLPYMLTLPPYGFFWFTLEDASQAPAWHPNPPELMPEYLTFVIRRELNEILEGKSREALEREVLPTYLPMRRWFAAKDERLVRVEIVEWLEMPDTLRPILLLELEATTATDERTRTERYLMPVGYLFESDIISAMPEQLSFARVRRFDKVGYLTDAFTFDTLAHTVVRLMRRNHRHETRAGVLAFRPTHALETVSIDDRAEIRRPAAEQTNSSLIIGEQAMLKLFRRITAGIHPEVEIGRVLTERGFANTPPLLGDITRIAPDGTEYVLGVVQGFIHNQGDAWSWTLDLLQRAILAGADEQGPQSVDSIFSELQHFVERLGTRLGELHVVLAQPADDPAFHPEAVSPAQVALWRESVSAQWHEALRLAEDITDPALMPLVEALQQCRTQFDAVIAQLAAGALGGLTIRTHGDLHLGQVLVVQDDAYIIDFEGEPARSLEERRRKTSPLRDVAGVLRSFDYAAHMARTSVTVDEVATEWREAIVTRFESMVHLVFVAAYKDATLQLCENWATQSDWDSLIDLFLIEKAAYEIAYEKSHRPDWVNVPLRGLSALAERLCQTPSGEHEL